METTKYAVIQLGHGAFGIGDTPEQAKIEAKKWLTSESYSEIDALDVQISTYRNNDGDLVLMECSEKYAETVMSGKPDCSYDIDDEKNILVLSSEIE